MGAVTDVETNVQLTPSVPTPECSIAVDFPGLTIGLAEYDEGPTGCTVLLFDRPARMAIDIGEGCQVSSITWPP